MLPTRHRPATHRTPQRRDEALVESAESFPLDRLLDAVSHVLVDGVRGILGLQSWAVKQTDGANHRS